MFAPGAARFEWFGALKASPRSCRATFSVICKLLNSATSISIRPGANRIFRPPLPYMNGDGTTKSFASNHCSRDGLSTLPSPIRSARPLAHPARDEVKVTENGDPVRSLVIELIIQPPATLPISPVPVDEPFSRAEREFVISGERENVALYPFRVAPVRGIIVRILWTSDDRRVIDGSVERVLDLKCEPVGISLGYFHLQLVEDRIGAGRQQIDG